MGTDTALLEHPVNCLELSGATTLCMSMSLVNAFQTDKNSTHLLSCGGMAWSVSGIRHALI